jgi:hypothetical protein
MIGCAGLLHVLDSTAPTPGALDGRADALALAAAGMCRVLAARGSDRIFIGHRPDVALHLSPELHAQALMTSDRSRDSAPFHSDDSSSLRQTNDTDDEEEEEEEEEDDDDDASGESRDDDAEARHSSPWRQRGGGDDAVRRMQMLDEAQEDEDVVRGRPSVMPTDGAVY